MLYLCTMKSIGFWLVCAVLLCSGYAQAQKKTFTRVDSYRVSAADSKPSARAAAVQKIKTLLLQDAGQALRSEETLKKLSAARDGKEAFSEDFFQKVMAATASIAEVKVMEEDWIGNTCHIEVRMTVDAREVSKKVAEALSEEDAQKKNGVAREKPAQAQAQQTAQKGEGGSEAYARSSISVLIINRPEGSRGAYDSQIQSYFSSLDLGGKYDINPVSLKILNVTSGSFSALSKPQRAAVIEQTFNMLELGREVVSFWYSRKPSGGMDLSRIWKRGVYNATDQSYLQAVATKRGVDDLKDAGLSLIGRSYVVALDVSGVALHEMPSTGTCYFSGSVDAYLYILQYDNATQEAIFDCWVDESTKGAERSKKVAAFNRMSFDVKHVLTSSISVSSLEASRGMLAGFVEVVNAASNNQPRRIGCGSTDGELQKFTRGGFKQAMLSLEELHSELKVKTPVVSTFPVRAKIGKKEDVSRSQLFRVSEYYADEANQLRRRNVAYIRATAVADNRYDADGKMQTSTFTPIASKKRIRKGMDLVQSTNARRMEYYADFALGDSAFNVNTGLEYVNFYLTGGFSGRLFVDLNICSYNNTFFGARLGYNLGFNIFSNLSVHAFAAAGAGYSSAGEATTYSDDSGFINAGTFSYGGTANLSYLYPVTLYFRTEFIGATPVFGGGIKYAF